MAFAFTVKVQVQSSTDGTSYVTDTGGDGDGTFTPTAGHLLLCASVLATNANDPTSVTGNGQTWTKLASATANSGTDNMSIFGCIVNGSPTDTAVTVNTNGTTLAGLVYVNDVTGAYVGGTLADVIAQSASGGGNASTGSVTLAAAANAANRAYAIFYQTSNTGSIAPGTNWTALFGANRSTTTPLREARDIWRSDAFDTTPNVTLGGTFTWGGLAIELRDTSAPPSGSTSYDTVDVIPI